MVSLCINFLQYSMLIPRPFPSGGLTHLKAGGDRSKEAVEKASGVGELTSFLHPFQDDRNAAT